MIDRRPTHDYIICCEINIPQTLTLRLRVTCTIRLVYVRTVPGSFSSYVASLGTQPISRYFGFVAIFVVMRVSPRGHSGEAEGMQAFVHHSIHHSGHGMKSR